jgi:hypothetical protein
MLVTNRHIQLAATYAKANFLVERKKFYHCTLAYVGNRFVEFGVNKLRTHPELVRYGYNEYSRIHSELDLLIKLNKTKVELKDISVMNFCFDWRVIRNETNICRVSKPCKHCASWVFDEFGSVTFLYKGKWVTV